MYLMTERRVDFYPRPPRGGRPAKVCRLCMRSGISIHALREEGDIKHIINCTKGTKFLSTPSARRATIDSDSLSADVLRFLSTPSARRATIDQQAEIDSYLISIHALREEGDAASCDVQSRDLVISIHALREEGDLLWEHWKEFMGEFLSTPSARRATTAWMEQNDTEIFLSTPSARRATS